MILAIGLWTFLRTLVAGSAAVALENLARRHQLLVLQRSVRRPRLARRDRILFSEAACQEQSSLVVSAPSVSSSFVRTTNGHVPCSLCEVCGGKRERFASWRADQWFGRALTLLDGRSDGGGPRLREAARPGRPLALR